MIAATVTASSETERSEAVSVVDNSGMSGFRGKHQFHNNDLTDMWLTEAVGEGEISIRFDFGRVEPLAEMWVWNYNEYDIGDKTYTARGLKNITIHYSTDGEHWREWKGEGYPFQLAKASGDERLRATNLNDSKSSPVRFGGLPARFIELRAKAKPGDGNWGGVDGKESVYGLSEVRFYRHVHETGYDELISADVISASGTVEGDPYNTVNHYGMTGLSSKSDAHDNAADGSTMWLAVPRESDKEVQIVYDFGGTFPVGEMHVWNYNRSGEAANWGMKEIEVYYSLNNRNWTPLKGDRPFVLARATGEDGLQATNLADTHEPIDFGGVLARYVKIVAKAEPGVGNWGGVTGEENRYGLSEVRFYAAEGFAAVPAPEWETLFSRTEGWTGADGIFSIPLSGYDRQGGALREDVTEKTLFLFSDTFVGKVEPTIGMRSAQMVNNTIAELTGGEPDPAKIEFKYGKYASNEKIESVFVPETHVLPENRSSGNTYWYWLQDGIAINGHVYIIPMIITFNPDGPPGFQFETVDNTLIKAPYDENGIRWEEATQHKTPLFTRANGYSYIFGAGIMPNTETAGAPDPDGYVYVYGYRDRPLERNLIVARVKEEHFDQFDHWEYFDGEGWSDTITDSAPLAPEVSPELSVTPLADGPYKGKYMLVYQKGSITDQTAFRLADHPWGPFGPETVIFVSHEAAPGTDIFSYNAKAHPHLSKPGELLVSYNLNTGDFGLNMRNGDIYHPRFFHLKYFKKQ